MILKLIGWRNYDCYVKEFGRNVTKQCIFPFNYKGTEHYGCIEDEKTNGKFWCPTNVDDNDYHINGGGYWGHCGENCYIDPNTKGNIKSQFTQIRINFVTNCQKQNTTKRNNRNGNS